MVCCCCGSTCLVPDDPSLATKSRFLGQGGFNTYKFLMAVYTVFWCVYWPVGENIHDGYKFVTHWTFYTAAFYFVISTITAIFGIGEGATPTMSNGPERRTGTANHHRAHLSAFARCFLCLQIYSWNIACLGSLVVVALFWTVLYDGGPLDSVDVNAHILIAIFMVVDQLLVATEYRLKQIFAVELYGLVYVAFNVTFYYKSSEDDRIIYDILDWEEGTATAIAYTVGILVVLLPLFALLHLGVFRLRESIYKSHRRGASAARASEDSGKVVCIPV